MKVSWRILPLKPRTLITVVVEGASGDTNGGVIAVRDSAGNPMAQTHTFSFTTVRVLN